MNEAIPTSPSSLYNLAKRTTKIWKGFSLEDQQYVIRQRILDAAESGVYDLTYRVRGETQEIVMSNSKALKAWLISEGLRVNLRRDRSGLGNFRDASGRVEVDLHINWN